MKRATHLVLIFGLLLGLGILAYIVGTASEPAAGLPEAPKKPAEGIEPVPVLAYYPNSVQGDYTTECTDVFPVEREVIVGENDDVVRALIEVLLVGPTLDEEAAGFTQPFVEGSSLLSVERQGTIVHLDFNEDFNKVAGSCRITSIRSAINSTLRQFSSIEGAVISVNGDVDMALQP